MFRWNLSADPTLLLLLQGPSKGQRVPSKNVSISYIVKNFLFWFWYMNNWSQSKILNLQTLVCNREWCVCLTNSRSFRNFDTLTTSTLLLSIVYDFIFRITHVCVCSSRYVYVYTLTDISLSLYTSRGTLTHLLDLQLNN